MKPFGASKLQLNYSSYFKCLFIFCSWSVTNPRSDSRERLASMTFITSSETSRSLQVHPFPLYQPFYVIISVYGHIPINIFLYNNVVILCTLFFWVSFFFFFSSLKDTAEIFSVLYVLSSCITFKQAHFGPFIGPNMSRQAIPVHVLFCPHAHSFLKQKFWTQDILNISKWPPKGTFLV